MMKANVKGSDVKEFGRVISIDCWVSFFLWIDNRCECKRIFVEKGDISTMNFEYCLIHNGTDEIRVS